MSLMKPRGVKPSQAPDAVLAWLRRHLDGGVVLHLDLIRQFDEVKPSTLLAIARELERRGEATLVGDDLTLGWTRKART